MEHETRSGPPLGATCAILQEGWSSFGGVGAWVLAVSVAELRDPLGSRALGVAGVALAAMYGLVVVSFVLQSAALLMVGAGLGGVVLAPAWFVAQGLRLVRGAAAARV